MALNSSRRRSSGLWAFAVQNRLLVLLFIAGVGLLAVSRGQGELTQSLRGAVDDFTSGAMEVFAAPAAEANRWVEGVGTFLTVYEENARLRDENVRLRTALGELGELQRKVRRFEELLRVPTEAPVAGVAGRVIADLSGPFMRSMLVNVGSAGGVTKGQAVVDDRGLLGRVVGTGKRSSRVLLLTDFNSRIPVIVEGANLKAILVGNNTDRPTLEYLPPGSRLTAGSRVLTTADGGALPPGIVVGVVEKGSRSPWVQLSTSERRADFVRILRYTAPVDVDGPDETAPSSSPGVSRVPSSASGGAAPVPVPSSAPRPVVMHLEGAFTR